MTVLLHNISYRSMQDIIDIWPVHAFFTLFHCTSRKKSFSSTPIANVRIIVVNPIFLARSNNPSGIRELQIHQSQIPGLEKPAGIQSLVVWKRWLRKSSSISLSIPIRAKSLDSIRFSLTNRFDNRIEKIESNFHSIRQSDKFAAWHWYSNSKLGVIFRV